MVNRFMNAAYVARNLGPGQSFNALLHWRSHPVLNRQLDFMGMAFWGPASTTVAIATSCSHACIRSPSSPRTGFASWHVSSRPGMPYPFGVFTLLWSKSQGLCWFGVFLESCATGACHWLPVQQLKWGHMGMPTGYPAGNIAGQCWAFILFRLRVSVILLGPLSRGHEKISTNGSMDMKHAARVQVWASSCILRHNCWFSKQTGEPAVWWENQCKQRGKEPRNW